jgi:hypothetical protein
MGRGQKRHPLQKIKIGKGIRKPANNNTFPIDSNPVYFQKKRIFIFHYDLQLYNNTILGLHMKKVIYLFLNINNFILSGCERPKNQSHQIHINCYSSDKITHMKKPSPLKKHYTMKVNPSFTKFSED